MFRSKRIYGLYLISAFVLILLAQLAFAQELTPAKKTAISWVDKQPSVGSMDRKQTLKKLQNIFGTIQS